LRIKEIIDENDVKKVLIGMPLLMSGKKGERAEKTEEFIKKLKQYVSVPVFTLDERLTTSEAKKIMISLGQKTGKKKEKIDRLSAALLLENYLRSIT
jgi:putative Holliday junction resolvase